ncbi:MAG: calycin-like domain-containing protein [Treponemataceae bacterium]|nr:calycin-like domain-containing protein [Treponemataceae bacterium]
MKKYFSVIALSFLVLSCLFAESLSSELEGQYEVAFDYSMTVKSGKGSCGLDENGNEILPIVVISADGEAKVNVRIPQFTFSAEKKIESYEIPSVDCLLSEDGCLMFSGKNITCQAGDKTMIVYYIDGKVKDGKLEMKMQVKAGKMPFKLTIKYHSL